MGAAAGRAGPVRVLVVDDDAVVRELVGLNLELEGFEVHTAVDGSDALARAAELSPAVVTLDVMMPGLSGWDVVARLRADPLTAHVKVVMVSARAQESDLRRAARLGADAYVTKPFDPADLVEAVRRLSTTGAEAPPDEPAAQEP